MANITHDYSLWSAAGYRPVNIGEILEPEDEWLDPTTNEWSVTVRAGERRDSNDTYRRSLNYLPPCFRGTGWEDWTNTLGEMMTRIVGCEGTWYTFLIFRNGLLRIIRDPEEDNYNGVFTPKTGVPGCKRIADASIAELLPKVVSDAI